MASLYVTLFSPSTGNIWLTLFRSSFMLVSEDPLGPLVNPFRTVTPDFVLPDGSSGDASRRDPALCADPFLKREVSSVSADNFSSPVSSSLTESAFCSISVMKSLSSLRTALFVLRCPPAEEAASLQTSHGGSLLFVWSLF